MLVTGELGAGKTTFVRGACRALGVEGPVVSPTFTIGRRYETPTGGRSPIWTSTGWPTWTPEEEGLLDDYLTPDAFAFVEWPAVAAAELPQPVVRVEIRHAGGDEREIELDWSGSAS